MFDDHVRVLFCDSRGVLPSVVIERDTFDAAPPRKPNRMVEFSLTDSVD